MVHVSRLFLRFAQGKPGLAGILCDDGRKLAKTSAEAGTDRGIPF
jgi:hypothetical protein